MNAGDVMTQKVFSVTPNTPVRQVASFLLEHSISAVPVVDAMGSLLGIVSEGDLYRRVEVGTLEKRSWWLSFFAAPDEEAREFKKTHGLVAADVMTKGAVVVTTESSLADVAEILDRRSIKRVPVVRDGKVVGIVSRANLVRALAKSALPQSPNRSDHDLRDAIDARMRAENWAPHAYINISVQDGQVELSGVVESSEIRDAVRILVEGTPGVRAVKESLAVYTIPMVV